ncbi:hypothetical protein [Paenibacillus sp. FSL R7-0333]|uniref:hypothetical protein n=1 Tax=Paenibacillus sp. FSL R7-0333 TaxID=1926587 RepID=UPI00096C1243|nr:hypothetical protein BK146_16940 [Paenibacillus sp. FSL R7-0333]
MSWYDDDFYQEPSEFEEQINALKESLMNAIKDEQKAEIERLRKENGELQEVKRDFEKIQQDYRVKERELEWKMKEAQTEARRIRLSTLLESFGVSLYRASYEYVKVPKCNKCDEHRRIYYKTPSGKDAYEPCGCDVSNTIYVPKEMICCEFRIDRRGSDKMTAWYKSIPKKDADDDYASYESSTHLDQLYVPGMEYEKLSKWSTFFKDKDDCQRFCNWLTEQEAVKKKEG